MPAAAVLELRPAGELQETLPDDVVEQTRARYVEAYERLTGEPFQVYLTETGSGS